MTKFKLFIKSMKYSVKLMTDSSRLLVVVYLLLNLLDSTLVLFNTVALKYVLDCLAGGGTENSLLWLWSVLYVVSIVTVPANNAAINIAYDSLIEKAWHKYECNLAEKLAELPLSVIDSSEGKDMIDDVRYSANVCVFTTYHIVQVIALLYSFVASYVTLVHFNIWFALLFLILTVPGIIFNQVFDRKAEELRRKQAPDLRKFCYYRWMLTDPWPAKDVRMYDLTEPIKARYEEEKSAYLHANKKLDKKKLSTFLVAEIIRRSGEITFTVFVVYKAIMGDISIGDVALYIGFALNASESFKKILSNLVMSYTRTTEIMKRVFDFFALETKTAGGHHRCLEEFESLTFDNVYFKYPHTEKYILQGASFTLKKGDKLSIVGINGSGKSTMIKLMLGLYEVESGRILINGYPMAEYAMEDVRKLFSALFQNFVQYPLTLRENIALSSPQKMQESGEIEQVLEQSGVYEDLKPKLEKGLDSFMTRQFDDKGTELSKGQWQKIALSRAYFKNAPVIIFDEPSAALDAEAEDRIFRNFEELSDGRTGVMISHRISSARMANKIIVLDGGKVVEEGTHDELAFAGGLYAKLYNLQREKYAGTEVE